MLVVSSKPSVFLILDKSRHLFHTKVTIRVSTSKEIRPIPLKIIDPMEVINVKHSSGSDDANTISETCSFPNNMLSSLDWTLSCFAITFYSTL